MQTPRKISIGDFLVMRSKWLEEHCVSDDVVDGRSVPLRCKTCGEPPKTVCAYVSVHDPQFGDECVGSGKVLRPRIPYCPRCEVRPEESGCFHDLEVPAGTRFF